MEQRIISNKVYESLQVPTENTRTTTGRILYANRFSGIAPVAMPDDLRNLIDSDFGLVGLNILIQLKQKMKGYRNGPWYVDSRDGVLYIHNRKFHEDPVYTYTYQGENGEVLKVSFAMQNITKKVGVSLSPTLDPDSKDLEIIASNVDDSDRDLAARLSPEMPLAPIDNLMVQNYGSDPWEDYRDHPTQNHLGEWTAENQVAKNAYWTAHQKNMEYRERVAEYEAKGPIAAYEAGKQRRFDELSISDLQAAINQIASKLPEDKQFALRALLRNCKNGKELEAKLKKLLEKEKYIFDKEDGMSFMVTEWVDPLDYDPEKYASSHAGAGVASGVNYQFGILPASERGYQALLKDPYTEVYTDMQVNEDKHYGQNQFGKKVKIRHMKTVDLHVPLFQLYHNLFSRFGGVDKYVWAANANANGGLKVTEKRLICNMQVVGRPLLESSQIINLENVGKRWSGPWYIKKCTHLMDPGQGYITNLELVKNNAMASSTSSSTGLSTQDVVSNDAKEKAKTDRGKDKESQSNKETLDLQFTFNEVVYFVEKFLDKDGRIRDIKGATEFIRRKAWYTKINAKDPVALAEGTVYSEGTTVTSSGKVDFGKLHEKPIRVASSFDLRFDYMKIATKVYKTWKKYKK